MTRNLRTALLGAAAGAVAGIVQPAVGKLEELLAFPGRDDANIAVHLMDASAKQVTGGAGLSPPAAWAAGTAFHVGYALFWGTAYAFAREKTCAPPALGALGLAGALYAFGFSRASAGVITGAELHPDARPAHLWMLHLTMPLVFGVTTAYLYERLRPLRVPPDGEADPDQRGRP